MSLPLNVDPSPQICTSSSSIARTSRVPVTARPIGVVLKYVRPADRMWNAPQASAARPSSTSAARQSTSRVISAPYAVARPGTEAMSGSSYCPRSAVYVHGTAPLSRIHATATDVSRPPENAIPTRSPTGKEVSTLDTGKVCTTLHDYAKSIGCWVRTSVLSVVSVTLGAAGVVWEDETDRRGSGARMMGRSHALSGWCAGLAVAPLIGLTSVAQVVPFAAATAGYALVPDLDHPGASASRLLGPVTRLVSGVVRAFSGVLYNLTKGPRDEESTGRHRHATHTLVAAVLLGMLAASLGDRGKWAVLAVAVTGLVLAADALGDWIIVAALTAAGWSVVGTTDPATALPGTSAADAVQAGLTEIGGWIGVAVALGMFVHCLGDSLTRSGCPWLWPLPIRGETWFEIRLPRGLRFRTDSWVERLVITPALVVAAVLLLPGAVPIARNVVNAVLSSTTEA